MAKTRNNWECSVSLFLLVVVLVASAPWLSRAEVSRRGEFHSKVSIEVPAIRGVAPTVEITYSSHAGNDIAGVGWRLNATSSIARTGSRGGVPRHPSPVAGDRFVLDGQELVPCLAGSTSPSCTTAIAWRGSSAGFYSTLEESYQRIEHAGGVAPWTVWSTSGIKRTYTTFDNGQSWLLTRGADRHSNGTDYTYGCQAGYECTLDAIRYGGVGPGPGAEIRFYYETRPDATKRATGTGFLIQNKRLRSIAVRFGGQLVRAYALSYERSSVSGRSLLRSVQQFGRDAAVDDTGDPGRITAGATPPLPATTFTTESQTPSGGWRFGTLVDQPDLLATAAASTDIPRHYAGTAVPGAGTWLDVANETRWLLPRQAVVGDWDGDGRADLATVYVGQTPVRRNCAKVSVDGLRTVKGGSTSIAAGTIATFPTGLAPQNCWLVAWTADVNGDHRDDLLLLFRDRLFTALWAGAGFVPAPASQPWALNTSSCAVADFDGDSRTDIGCLLDQPNEPRLKIARSRGDGTFVLTDETPTGATRATSDLRSADFNGDGWSDLVFLTDVSGTKQIQVGISRGNGSFNWSTSLTWWPSPTAAEWPVVALAIQSFDVVDFDGDGLSDLAYQVGSNPNIYMAWAVQGWALYRFEARVVPRPAGWTQHSDFGDVDGNGVTDLLSSTGAAAIGDGRGGFAVPAAAVFRQTCAAMTPSAFSGISQQLVDVDGDGRQDLLCIDATSDPYSPITASDFPSYAAPRDAHRYLSADLDGNGETDYVYPYAGNPGVRVFSVLTGGTDRRVSWSAPTSMVPGLDNSSATGWFAADVGGPQNRADGKDDLVMVDKTGTELWVYTLISRGDGTYDARFDRPWRDANGGQMPYGSSDLRYWMSLDVDGNGTTDLVHLLSAGAGVRVEMLMSRGDGTWEATTRDYFQAASAALVAASEFRPMDVNGDGLLDLVHVQSGGSMTNTLIRTLINVGDRTFLEAEDTAGMMFTDVTRWRALDANGDGLADLIHIRRSALGHDVSFNVLLSRGNGTFGDHAIHTSGVNNFDDELRLALEASSTYYPTDINGDGLTDLVHVSRYRKASGGRGTVVVRMLNPGAHGTGWQTHVDKITASTLPALPPWGWRTHRDPSGLNDIGFAFLDDMSGRSMIYDLPSDRIATIDNGTGGVTVITYAPYGGTRTYVPSGFRALVVASVESRDRAYVPPQTETTTYLYRDAWWSDATSTFVGYGYVGALRAGLLGVTLYRMDNLCPGSVMNTTSYNVSSGVRRLSYTSTQYVAPGNFAPYVCLSQQQSEYRCEGTNTCRLERDTQFTYDAYGNARAVVERAADAPTRRTESPVAPNAAAYVVDLPMLRAVYQEGPTPVLLSQTLFVYDGNPDYTSPPGALGELRKVQVWDDRNATYAETTMSYNAFGQITRVLGPTGVWQTVTYDPAYQAFRTSTCDAVGCTKTSWDGGTGKILESTDRNNQSTRFSYDAHGRNVSIVRPDGGFTTRRLLAVGTFMGPTAGRQRLRIEVSDGSSGDGVLWSEQLFDGTGRFYRVDREGGTSRDTDYDGHSRRPRRVSDAYATGGTPVRWTTFAHDVIGRVVSQTAPGGATRLWRFEVEKTTMTNELGIPHVRVLDGNGNPIAVRETVNGVQAETRYNYDAIGRMVRSTDALGNVTSYSYDTQGRTISTVDPDRGAHHYAYRLDGSLASHTDRNGQKTTYIYDAVGRMMTREDRAGGAVVRTISWTYDTLPNVGPLGSSVGRVVAVDDKQAASILHADYTYDVEGRISEENRCIDKRCFLMRRAYDAAGRLAHLTYPDSDGKFGDEAETVVHVYDAAGRLRSVGGYVTAIDYNLEDLPTRFAFGNGVAATYGYDPDRHWTTSVQVNNGTVLLAADYKRDRLGRIAHAAEVTPINKSEARYDYDDAGRLTQVRSTDPLENRKFDYDAIGRITYSSTYGNYRYDDPVHIHAMTSADSGAKREYDRKGNAIGVTDPSGRRLKLTWTVDDRPASIDSETTSCTFAYDPEGRRVKKHCQENTTLYFGAYLQLENDTYIKYYFTGNRPIARRVRTLARRMLDARHREGADVHYYHTDHSPSTRLQSDAGGRVVGAYQYDAYGNVLRKKGQLADDVAFGGTHGDESLGLVYLGGARLYDSASARFLSPDTIVPDQYRPQSHDRYAYVENDPINYWDPSGHVRRDIEIMMERKQTWRNIQVEWESSFNLCIIAAFCTEAEPSGWRISYLVNPDGSRKEIRNEYVAPNTDPAIAAWSRQQEELRKETQNQEAQVEVAALMVSVLGDAVSNNSASVLGDAVYNAFKIDPMLVHELTPDADTRFGVTLDDLSLRRHFNLGGGHHLPPDVPELRASTLQESLEAQRFSRLLSIFDRPPLPGDDVAVTLLLSRMRHTAAAYFNRDPSLFFGGDNRVRRIPRSLTVTGGRRYSEEFIVQPRPIRGR